ncbi:hypothetical protein IL306_000597 [Fusarium sp. DS 682]|nr:hypothetical protein IL306_000597 [Fusarium sp. DS 682]
MALQRSSGDIRDRYDIKDDYERRIASRILNLQPPTDCEGTTGLDALIVVLRRIYTATMLGPTGLAQTEWMKNAEEENPILKHAWHFMGDSEEEKLAAGRARANLIEALGTEMNAGTASFKELCTSSLMNRTFWSQVPLSLFWPTLYVPSMRLVHQDPNDRADTNLVRLNREKNPDMSLQEAINGQFGIEQEDSQHVIRRPKYPMIIRVLLRTKDGSNRNRIEFEDIRQFFLPQWVETDDDEGHILMGGEPQRYTIIAVVRMRPDETAVNEAMQDQDADETYDDVVRTYAQNGPNIIAAYEDGTLMPGLWSVEDLRPYPLEFMLFYMQKPGDQRDDPTRLPEHAQPPRFDITAWQKVNRALDPLVAEIQSNKAQSAQGNAPGGGRADVQNGPHVSQPRASTEGSASVEGSSASQQVKGSRSKRPRMPQPSQAEMFKRSRGGKRG